MLVVELEVEAEAVVIVIHRDGRPSGLGRRPGSLASSCPKTCQGDLTGMSAPRPQLKTLWRLEARTRKYCATHHQKLLVNSRGKSLGYPLTVFWSLKPDT